MSALSDRQLAEAMERVLGEATRMRKSYEMLLEQQRVIVAATTSQTQAAEAVASVGRQMLPAQTPT